MSCSRNKDTGLSCLQFQNRSLWLESGDGGRGEAAEGVGEVAGQEPMAEGSGAMVRSLGFSLNTRRCHWKVLSFAEGQLGSQRF